jgi:hypothetical protein
MKDIQSYVYRNRYLREREDGFGVGVGWSGAAVRQLLLRECKL